MGRYNWFDSKTAGLQATEAITALPSIVQGAWLSGHGAPPSGSGMLPLDGVSDPWRWSPVTGSWIGPAYTVHVTEGAPVPFSPPSSEVASLLQELDLGFNVYGSLSDYGHNRGNVLADVNAPLNPLAGSVTLVNGSVVLAEVPLTFSVTGDVVAFLSQYEIGWSGPTTVPAQDLDVLAFLGDLEVDGPYEFSETTPTGLPGQFWLDVDTRDVYLRGDTDWTKVATLPAPS